MTPIRIKLERTKGWRKPDNTVVVSRPSRWGNPFTIGCEAWRFSTGVPFSNPETIDEILADYRYFVDCWLMVNPGWIDELRGKNLACWCKLSEKCHADVLLEIANKPRKQRAPNKRLHATAQARLFTE